MDKTWIIPPDEKPRRKKPPTAAVVRLSTLFETYAGLLPVEQQAAVATVKVYRQCFEYFMKFAIPQVVSRVWWKRGVPHSSGW